MGIPCKVTPKKGIAKALGLKENVSMSYSEWVEALKTATEKGDISIDKNGNIEFGKKAAAEIRKAGLLDNLKSRMGGNKETKVYTSENLEEIDSSGFNDVQRKVIGDIEKIIKAIDKLVENVTGNKLSVNVHYSEAEYAKAIVNAGGTEAMAKSRGFYLDSDGTIHLNMNRVTSETMMHEAIHPILDYLEVNNSKVIDSLYKQLKNITGGQEFAKRAAKMYKGDGALTIKKEAITDFIANIADGTFELTKSNFEKIKDFIYDLLKTLGIKIPAKYSDIRDIESLQELAKFISQSFATGQEIKSVKVDTEGTASESDKKGQAQLSKTDDMPMSALNVLYGDSEKLAKPIKKTDNATVAKQIEEIAAEHWGGNIVTSSNITAEQEAEITENGVNEAIKAYEASGKNAADWYSTAIETAIAVAGVVHPELNSKEIASKVEAFNKEKDPVAAAQMALRMALAITSQNLNVDANTKYAEEQFEYFKKHGRFDPSKEYGAKAPAISGNLELANLLIDTLGLNKAEEFISKDFSVRQLEDAFKVATGKKLNIEGLRDDAVNGAAIFGPKIGQGFLQNLMGKFDPVTIDLWMRRTWGRWTGDVVGESVTKDRMYTLYSTVKDAIRNKELKIDLPQEFSEYKPVQEKNKGGKSFWTMDSKFGDRIDADLEFKDKIHKLAKEISLKANSLYKIIHDFPMSKEMYDNFISGKVSYVKTAEKLKANRDRLGEKYSDYAAKERAKKNKPISKGEWIKAQDKKEGRIYSPTNEQISEKKPKWGNAAKNIVDELNPIDIPSAMDRRVITRVVNNIRKGMAERGYDVTNADVQALLWYPEKDIWAKLRGEQESNLKLSYDDQFIKLAKERGLGEQAEKVANEIRSGRAKSNSATSRQKTDESISSTANEKRENVDKKPSTKGKIQASRVEETTEALRERLDPDYKNTIEEKLSRFDKQMADKNFPSVLEVAEQVLPRNIFNKYKSLYELAARNNITVSNEKLPPNVNGAWAFGSIQLNKDIAKYNMANYNEFAEVLNHEIIHGLISKGIKNNYALFNDLQGVMNEVVNRFDSATEEVKEVISYIQDVRRQYKSKDILGATDKELFSDNFREIGDLEELITYAFTNKSFADFLDSIPASKNLKIEGKSIFQQLKNIIRGFISKITKSPTALDEINSVVDKYFDTSFVEKDIAKRNKEYGWGLRFKANKSIFDKYKNDPKLISEAYHKGDNPELEKAVDEFLGVSKPSTKGKIQASRVENDKVADTYVEPHMTESEDGKDYVFFHVSNADRDMLIKGIDSRKFYSMRTSSQEKSTQYGVASFYTKPEDAESMVSGNKYVVRVPKDKVYPMDLDPNNYKEKALSETPEGTPFRSEVVKKKMADMAAKDGYRMAVGEWRFDRKGETIPENEFRADALIPLRPTKESPDSYESNLSKGMERVPHPQQEEYLRGKQLEDLAQKVYSYYSSKNKYGEAYQIANNIRVYGGIMEGLNTPNERVRPLTKEEFDIMTKGLPKEIAAVANNIKFSKEEDSVNETMKDWVVSQFEAGIGESDLVDVLKEYGLSDKEAADTVAAAVESLNEPTKAEKNKQRADSVNPFLNYTPDETGVQNMVATLERIQSGKDPIEIDPETKRDWKTVMQRAKDFFLNPNNSVDNLIQDLRDGKAPTAEDIAVMTMHKVKLDNDMAEALEQRAKLVAEGNPNFLIQDAKISEISSRLEEYYEAARRSAYEQGLAFGIRKMMLANDYSIGTLLRRLKAVGDQVVPKDVVKQLESLSTRIKEQSEEIARLEDELAKEKAQDTLDTIINNVKPPKVDEGKAPEKSRVEKAIKAIEGIRAKIKNRSYSDATLIVAAVDSGLMVIEKSLKAGLSVSRAIEKGVKAINKAMKGAKWDEEAFRKDVTEGFISEGIDIDKTEISELEVKDNKLEITRGYLETLVENGYDTIDKMVDFIKGTEAGENFTEREIMDAISGYGETEYPPEDKIAEKISIAKGEGKALSALADVISGMLPKKSGFQRRKRTDRERRLLQETRQKLKAFPEDAEKSAKNWASSLDRIKSAYKNRIADLNKAINEGKKIFKEKRELELDKEAKELKEQKEALQAVYDIKFASEIKSNIERLTQRAIGLTNDINKAKKNNDPDAERRAKIQKELTEGVINDLKAAAKANRSEQEVKLEQMKKSLKAQIETLNKKIDGTYEEKAKIDVTLDEETIDLMQERDQLKEMLSSTTNRNETDAERAERLTEYYEKQVAQLKADIENMNIGYRVKSTVSPTPEMQKVKDKLDDLREMRKMLREQLGLAYLRDVKLAEKRNERMLKALEQKKQAVINGTYKAKVKKASPTSKLIEIQKKTKAALENEIEQIIADRERANRGKFKKIVDSTSEVFRASVLSGVATVEKLTGYGLMETLLVHPIQGMVVGQATRYIPYISRINKMAGGRMTLGFGKEAKITAKAYAEFFSKKTWADTAKVVKTGKSELDLLWGEHKVAHPEIGAWVGHLHKALKNPTLRASFVRHMEGNLVYQVEVLGMDSNDPATIAAAARASLIDSYSDILLNKNWLSSAWNSMIRGAELMGKKDSAYLKNTGIALAGILKIFEPVTGVPVNAANRLASYYPPIGLVRALGGIIVNKAAGRKPEDMTKQEAADIIRNIKAAGTGAIGYAIGYMFSALFGGSDDDDETKNELGLKKGEFAFMSKHLGHHPLWEIMQIGATDKRIDDNGEDTSSKKLLNYVHLQYEYVENTPFFDFPMSVKEAVTEEGGASRVVGGVLRSLTTPMLVQQLSKYMDTDSEGNPINRQRDGLLDELKYGLYPFRKDLPVKGGLMIKEDHRKYFEDINFRPSLDKKTSDKFTLKGKQVMTDEEYSQYTSRVDSDFNSFLTENIDNLKYRTYTSEEQKEMNKDLVEPMNPAEINIEFEKKKKDMLSRAKSAIDSKYTAEYKFNKGMITKSVYDSEIKSSKTELENIVDFINNNYKNKEERKKREKREKKRK